MRAPTDASRGINRPGRQPGSGGQPVQVCMGSLTTDPVPTGGRTTRTGRRCWADIRRRLVAAGGFDVVPATGYLQPPRRPGLRCHWSGYGHRHRVAYGLLGDGHAAAGGCTGNPPAAGARPVADGIRRAAWSYRSRHLPAGQHLAQVVMLCAWFRFRGCWWSTTTVCWWASSPTVTCGSRSTSPQAGRRGDDQPRFDHRSRGCCAPAARPALRRNKIEKLPGGRRPRPAVTGLITVKGLQVKTEQHSRLATMDKVTAGCWWGRAVAGAAAMPGAPMVDAGPTCWSRDTAHAHTVGWCLTLVGGTQVRSRHWPVR